MVKKRSGKGKLVDEIVKKTTADKDAMENLAEEMASKIVDVVKDEAIGKLLKDGKSLKDVIGKTLQKEGTISDLADDIDDELALEDKVSDKLKENTKFQKKVLGIIVENNRFKKHLREQLKDEMSGDD